MLRSLVVIMSCACVAIVLSEAAAALLMWKGGLLTEHHVREIRLVFSNSVPLEVEDTDASPSTPLPSLSEVTQARAIKIFEIERRETDLNLLKQLTDAEREGLNAQLELLRTQRKSFAEELERLQAKSVAAATRQARGVLSALPRKDAAEKLMQLPLGDAVVLLRGMPEETIAEILKEFNGTPEQDDRGRKIFEAISHGEPIKSFVDDARQKHQEAADAPKS